MKVYTKTGDKGFTSLYDGNRIQKDAIFFEVLGCIDELSSNIGLLWAIVPANIDVMYLRTIQRTLQSLGTEIATVNRTNRQVYEISTSDITELEENIDSMETNNPRLTQFIIPGMRSYDAQSHICRCICRRLERWLWSLEYRTDVVHGIESIHLGRHNLNPNIFSYVNRLSDYFFVFARYLCTLSNSGECIM